MRVVVANTTLRVASSMNASVKRGRKNKVVGLQEIASPDVAGTVSQKRGPALPSRRMRSRRAPVLLHCALAGFDPVLEQFSANPLGPPQRVFARHRADQRQGLGRDAQRRPWRLRQRQRALKPARCQRRSVSGWTTRSTFLHVGVMAASATSTIRSSRITCGRATRPLQHAELVSEQGDFGEQRPSRAKQVDESGGEHGTSCANIALSPANFPGIGEVAKTTAPALDPSDKQWTSLRHADGERVQGRAARQMTHLGR